jgi:hypothetical protein
MMGIASSSSVTIHSFSFLSKQKLSIYSIKGHPSGFHRRLFLWIVPFHPYLVALAEFYA